MPDDPLGIVIGAREIYDELLGVRDDVRTLAQNNTTTVDKLADHESRIRAIERWKYAIPLSAIGGIAAAVYAVATK